MWVLADGRPSDRRRLEIAAWNKKPAGGEPAGFYADQIGFYLRCWRECRHNQPNHVGIRSVVFERNSYRLTRAHEFLSEGIIAIMHIV